ncbi:MAG: outer membrane lipoprotein carrier protein LolA [Saprospiraceae bacterium]|nr:outer membrane lipoprotein carrier protein LolA [Saprospiraceae bacterium]
MLRILLLLLLTCSGIIAQTDRNPDAEATKILQDLEKKMQNFADIIYHFTLQVEIPEAETQFQKGVFYTKKEAYRLEVSDYILLTDGRLQWVVNKEAKEIQIHDFEPLNSEDLSHPQNLLAIYNNPEFDYRLEFEGAQGDKMIQQIEFKPLKKDSEYTKARLTINKKSGFIDQIELLTKDGSRYFLTIEKTNGNQKLATSLFQVQKEDFPNYQFEDLRLN